jgi:hypothetical protein
MLDFFSWPQQLDVLFGIALQWRLRFLLMLEHCS